jgi:LmbE family N-acetylglucosaminyl deacetylase
MENAGNALAVVAHPDDCIIFALPLIENLPQYQWHIIYLTYRATDPRAVEVAAFWNNRSVTTEFLGLHDDYKDQETQHLNYWDRIDVEMAIRPAVFKYDPVLIVTHNADGDYGHIHHRIVHDAVQAIISIPKIYFASTFNATDTYCAREYDLDKLPLHRSVIEGFQDRLIGRYIVTDPARTLI